MMLRRRLRTLGNLGMGETHCKNFRLGKGPFFLAKGKKKRFRREESLGGAKKANTRTSLFFRPVPG